MDGRAQAAALRALLAEHREDPRPSREADGRTESEAYHEELGRWLSRLVSRPSDALDLAARAQHLRRWEVPRSSFPPGRKGYLAWRRAAASHAANRAAVVLRAVGVDSAVVDRVRALVEKRGLGRDPEVQALEDAACLTFFAREAADFASGRPRTDVERIVRKTLAKMSARARALLGEAMEQEGGPVAALVRACLPPEQEEAEGPKVR